MPCNSVAICGIIVYENVIYHVQLDIMWLLMGYMEELRWRERLHHTFPVDDDNIFPLDHHATRIGFSLVVPSSLFPLQSELDSSILDTLLCLLNFYYFCF